MMTVATRLAWAVLAGSLLLLSRPAAAEALPPAREVYELLATQPAGLSAEELNRAALKGLVRELRGRLVIDGLETNTAAAVPAVARAQVLDQEYGWVRLTRIDASAPDQFNASLNALLATNALKGLILDLRGADGTDYAAAGLVADRFLSAEQKLLSWPDGGESRSMPKTNALLFPVSILVNERTRGAAEALAGVLRHTQTGLVLGENTGGQARVLREHRLPSGVTVRLAGEPVRLGNDQPLDTALVPDIPVAVDEELERVWLDDPFQAPNGANGRVRRRVNEADLVRQQRGDQAPERATETAPPIQDPALARALDLIKGLAVIQPRRDG